MPNTDPATKAHFSAARLPRGPANAAGCGILLFSLIVLAALFFVALGVVALWLRSTARAALPVLDGDLHVAGLSAAVMVRRDSHGLPHIEEPPHRKICLWLRDT